jgi:hypothetical protein
MIPITLRLQVLPPSEQRRAEDLLLRPSVAWVNSDLPRSTGRRTDELLADLFEKGACSGEQIDRAVLGLKECHEAVLEATISKAGLERLLEPDPDIGKLLIGEARQLFGQCRS